MVTNGPGLVAGAVGLVLDSFGEFGVVAEVLFDSEAEVDGFWAGVVSLAGSVLVSVPGSVTVVWIVLVRVRTVVYVVTRVVVPVVIAVVSMQVVREAVVMADVVSGTLEVEEAELELVVGAGLLSVVVPWLVVGFPGTEVVLSSSLHVVEELGAGAVVSGECGTVLVLLAEEELDKELERLVDELFGG